MKSKRKQNKYYIIIVGMALLVLSVVIIALIARKPRMLVYNIDNHTVYYKGSSEILLNNISNPAMAGSDKIIGIFEEDIPFVGIYDITNGIITNIAFIEDINKALGTDIIIEDVSNLQWGVGEPKTISFILDKTLYEYNMNSKKANNVWEFTGPIAEQAYYWLDDSKLLLLDEMQILNDWKFFLLDIETGETQVVDYYVSCFGVWEDKIVYGKKYYMGAWCEWELHFIDTNFNEIKEAVRNPFWAIDKILFGEEDMIYTVYDMDRIIVKKHKGIYKVTDSKFGQRKIAGIDREEILLKIQE